MGAQDYMVGSAPGGGSYVPVETNFGQRLAKLPQTMFDATQRKRTLDMQRAFPDGIPKDASGNPDVNAIIDKGAKIGGLEYAQPLMQMLLGKQIGDQNARILGEGEGSNSGGMPNSPAAAGPANLKPQSQAAPPAQPQLSSAGTDNAGSDTVRSVATEAFGGRDVSGLIPRFAAAAGVNPDAPLNPQQVSQLRTMMTRTAQNLPKQPTATDATGAVPPQPQSGAPFAPAGAGGQPVPQPQQGGAPFAPAPQQQGPGAPQAQPASAAAGLVPAGVDPRGFADALRKRAQGMRQQAVRVAPFNAASATQFEKQADAFDARAKLIDDAISKELEPTPEIKNARASGAKNPIEFERTKEQNKDDVTRYGKSLSAIQGSAQAANRMLEHIQFAEGVYRDPNFYSGTGEGVNLMYKKVVNALNPNSTEPLAQEAFRKTMAASVLNQVEQLKDDTAAVGGGGRIFQAQIELMEKAANNPDNSIPANRLLTEIAKRGALMSKQIAKMANSYNGGHLDAAFAQKVDDYYTQHPMFSEAETKDIRLVAPPVAPKLDTKEQASAWAKKVGLKPGDPMKLPSGKIVPAP